MRQTQVAAVADAIANLPEGSEHLGGGVRRYLMDGIMPGGFLAALLANDLEQAALMADKSNAANLAELGFWLNYHLPTYAIGDYPTIHNWEGYRNE